jgi:CubicO group peptidase (beta-lactamase class C family)
MARERIDAVVARALAEGAAPGAALVVGRGGQIVLEGYYGTLARGDSRVTADTVYDLSSLTKPLATLACVLRVATAARGLSLSDPLHQLLPELVGHGRDARRREITVRHALGHCTGLPARGMYFERLAEAERRERKTLVATEEGARRVVAMACEEALLAAPGQVVTYSDVGYILLGEWLKRASGRGLDLLFSEEVTAPLDLRDTGFMSAAGGSTAQSMPALARIAPTDLCPWRGRIVRGEVQDENAYAMGGVAGHAGLFSTAVEVHRIVSAFVRSLDSNDGLFAQASVRECFAGPGSVVGGSTWSLGWDTPTPGASSAGKRVSARSFGHLGFTGTSVWIDLDRGMHVVLLTNRVHPDKNNLGIREMRPRVHDAVFEMMDREGL